MQRAKREISRKHLGYGIYDNPRMYSNQETDGCFLDILTKGDGDMKIAVELHDAILKGLLANTAMLIRGFCRQGRMNEASELL
uniref:Uncharacterized protein n=1 Tax=Brassica oleracea TaxID=3712 RepID=A0A3P6G0Q6_BRAOL|nr:unnamed protein product [Brassica oleracea]